MTKCTSATFTPVFLPTYTSLSISNSVAATLPFSLPLFPSSLLLTLLLQSLAITLYAFHSFPRHSLATDSALAHRRALGIYSVLIQLLAVSVGFAASVSQRIVLDRAVGVWGEGSEIVVSIGRGFGLLWAALAFGVVGEGWALVAALRSGKGGDEEMEM